MLKPYLFMIRSTRKRARPKGKRIFADSYRNALNKILTLYPVKRISTKYAKSMDVVSAKVEAATQSKTSGKIVFINTDMDMEAVLSNTASNTTITAFKGGTEISVADLQQLLPSPVKESKVKTTAKESKVEKAATSPKTKIEVAAKTKKITNQKIKNVMETKTKAVKKTAKKATKTAAKKADKTRAALSGKKKELSVKEIGKLIAKGSKVQNESGNFLSAYGMGRKANQDRVMTVYVSEVK